jgi:hypothetical protein
MRLGHAVSAFDTLDDIVELIQQGGMLFDPGVIRPT